MLHSSLPPFPFLLPCSIILRPSFPRIPKPVQDSMVAQLQAAQLPCKAVGNAGQGGADRRGLDEPNRRPASVKASLSVAFGQRAPNRATAREEGRGLGAGMRGTYGGGGGVVGEAAGEALRARWVNIVCWWFCCQLGRAAFG